MYKILSLVTIFTLLVMPLTHVMANDVQGKPTFDKNDSDPTKPYYNFKLLKRSSKEDARRTVFYVDDQFNEMKDKKGWYQAVDGNICSAGVVQFDQEVTFPDGPVKIPFLLTAHHCNLFHADEVRVEHMIGFQGSYKDDGKFSYARRLGQGTNFIMSSGNDVEIFFNGDARDEEYQKYAEVLKPANKISQIGEKLRVVGFPQGQGPYTLDCVYAGRELSQPAYGPYIDRRLVFSVLYCPSVAKKQITLSGMSGSPVLNEKNEYVGTFHTVKAQVTKDKDAAHVQTGYAYFTPVTDDLIKIDRRILSGIEDDGFYTLEMKSPTGEFTTCSGIVGTYAFPKDEFKCKNNHGEYIMQFDFKGVLLNP